MADNVAITAGSGTTVSTEEITTLNGGAVSAQHVQRVAVSIRTADGAANDLATNTGAASASTLRVALADESKTTLGQTTMSASLPVAIASDQSYPFGRTVSTDVTRPADTNAYVVNDAWSDSTSAPTSGGFTFTNVARASGGSGVITDAFIATNADASTLLQGEIWLFDTAVTNINDNSAFAVSDAEIKTCIGKIPFIMEDAGNNGAAHVTGLNIGFTTVGSANLRFLVRVKNAYTPVSSEVLTVRLKIQPTT